MPILELSSVKAGARGESAVEVRDALIAKPGSRAVEELPFCKFADGPRWTATRSA